MVYPESYISMAGTKAFYPELQAVSPRAKGFDTSYWNHGQAGA